MFCAHSSIMFSFSSNTQSCDQLGHINKLVKPNFFIFLVRCDEEFSRLEGQLWVTIWMMLSVEHQFWVIIPIWRFTDSFIRLQRIITLPSKLRRKSWSWVCWDVSTKIVVVVIMQITLKVAWWGMPISFYFSSFEVFVFESITWRAWPPSSAFIMFC